MEHVMITRYGGPEVFEVQHAEDPHAGPGEVRIRVHGAGVNFADLSARAGLYPEAPKAPMVVGYEVAGEVDEVGDGVEHLSPGDRVFSVTRFGGYADVVVVPAYQAQRIPDGKDLVAAAGVPVPYLTAFVMLNRLGSVRPGDTVLIHAAAGGVGLAALQLAKDLGAQTIGTASARKHERLRELGLDHAIDYHTQDFLDEVLRITDGRGVDVALDAVGGTSARKSFKALAPMGRLFMFGVSSANANSRLEAWKTLPKMLATAPVFHALQLMNTNKGVFGVNMAGLWHLQDLIAENLVELSTRWETGRIDPLVDRTYPFSRAGEAHERLQTGQNFGKVVLVPDERYDATT